MSFLKDIAYGFGASKEKPPGYDERTAASIEATRGRDEADRYRESVGGSPQEASFSYGPTIYDRPPDRSGETLPRYLGTNPAQDFMRDQYIGRMTGLNKITGNPFNVDDYEDISEADYQTYLDRTAIAGDRAKKNFMGTGLTQQEYARGQQYGFSTGSDGQLTAQDRYGPEPTITDPNAPDATDPESTTFNPNNAFLRNRMRMQQEQGGGIMPMPFPKGKPPVTGGPAIFPEIPRLPPVGAEPPITGGPVPITPPQMPMLPAPNMPPQLRGIMGLSDRSNVSPAMRYAAENYYRLGGRQMMNDEYERGRTMIQGQSV
jgi:hypothetical protein